MRLRAGQAPLKPLQGHIQRDVSFMGYPVQEKTRVVNPGQMECVLCVSKPGGHSKKVQVKGCGNPGRQLKRVTPDA